MKKHEKLLEDLEEIYKPYTEMGFAISELSRIESLRESLHATKDPDWVAFRENPVTVKLYKAAIGVYKASTTALSNDDGSMTQIERARLHVGKKWATWFIKSLGGDPKKIKKEVEKEIERFADSAGLKE